MPDPSQPAPLTRVVDAALAPVAVEILVDAFYADPLWGWAFPDDAQRREQHRAVWGMAVEGALRYPWVRLAEGDTAAAVWIPPGGTEMTEADGIRFEQLVAELLGPDAPRALGAFEALDAHHPYAEQHFYLSLLGTASAHRGHGHGLGLLADCLREIDVHAMPAYLESSNPANVALYARHGFAPCGVVEIPGGGPQIVTMWREPREPRERSRTALDARTTGALARPPHRLSDAGGAPPRRRRLRRPAARRQRRRRRGRTRPRWAPLHR